MWSEAFNTQTVLMAVVYGGLFLLGILLTSFAIVFIRSLLERPEISWRKDAERSAAELRWRAERLRRALVGLRKPRPVQDGSQPPEKRDPKEDLSAARRAGPPEGELARWLGQNGLVRDPRLLKAIRHAEASDENSVYAAADAGADAVIGDDLARLQVRLGMATMAGPTLGAAGTMVAASNWMETYPSAVANGILDQSISALATAPDTTLWGCLACAAAVALWGLFAAIGRRRQRLLAEATEVVLRRGRSWRRIEKHTRSLSGKAV